MNILLLREVVAVLLAGGAGERLYPLTRDRAKPAVFFGGPYRIIDFTLSNCINSGLRRIFIATQYKAQSLNRHVRTGWSGFGSELGEFVEVLPGVRQGVASELAEALPGTVGEPPLDSIFLAPTAGGEPRWSLWGEPEG